MADVPAPPPRGTAFIKGGLVLLAGLICLWQVPHRWCARPAADWQDPDLPMQTALARGVERWVSQPLWREQFQTGSPQFDGEWLFGTYLMAGMGFGQLALGLPEQRIDYLEAMEQCIDFMLSDPVRAFDIEMWNSDPLETLADPQAHHAAYLGYLNLLLSLNRFIHPDTPHAALNDRISRSLASRLAASPILLLESYPGEVYPVDNTAVAASLGLYERATGEHFGGLLDQWGRHFRDRYIDSPTGLLIQAVEARHGTGVDHPRGSGTALAVYFLSFSHPELSASLYGAIKAHLSGRFLGFGGVREYPSHLEGGGDIDSGPVFLGFGMSATGFSLAGARLHDDPLFFRRLYSTAHLCGAPSRRQARVEFVTGGPLGNAILLAMMTAAELPGEGME